MSRILITSALPYINGVKHLGNLVGSMLPADIYARFMRARGHDVLYICATDEHGTPAELAAREAGQEVSEYCAEQHDIQRAIYRSFRLSFDHFGRSSSPQNVELTQAIYRALDDNGYIDELEIEQVYSVDDGRYLPDRYIIGTCPKCGYPAARGDQCENCTSVLDPTDLIDPRSAISGSSNLEVRKTKHLFLKLDTLEGDVREWVDSRENWPKLVKSIANKWLNEGLRSRGITRDLSWGVPVPREGLEDKVFYVWFDAPIEYIAATKEWSDADPENRSWKRWWWEADDVRYVQFMAKDNIPFHAIFFPAILLGTREPWKQADYIKGFNWLTFYGGKFSTSQRRGVFMDQALDEFPSDYWRYWLIANAPESADSSFTFESFADMINADLNDNLGNFVNRTLKLTASRFGNEVPAGGGWTSLEEDLAAEVADLVGQLGTSLENMEFRKLAAAQRALWAAGNGYIAKAAPWTVVKTDRERAACILRVCLNLVRLYAVLVRPTLPDASDTLLRALNVELPEDYWPDADDRAMLRTLEPGHGFTVPDVVFRKIAAEEVAELTARYGGGAEAEP